MNIPDHFALFGLPERFELDRADLEKRYLALSREMHPDRHATGSPKERLVAVQRTTDLNLAYKTLRDDFLRAEHLLRRRGIQVSEAESQDSRATVDTSLLMEVMELREALSDARAAKDMEKVTALAGNVRGRSEVAWAQIRTGFGEVEGGEASSLSAVLAQITALRYYRRFLEEVTSMEEE